MTLGGLIVICATVVIVAAIVAASVEKICWYNHYERMELDNYEDEEDY